MGCACLRVEKGCVKVANLQQSSKNMANSQLNQENESQSANNHIQDNNLNQVNQEPLEIQNQENLPINQNSFSSVNNTTDFPIKNYQFQSKLNPYFNFPSLNEYTGKGVKKIKSYISTIPKEKLEKIRREFWTTRNFGDKNIWSALEACCEMEADENITVILEAAGVNLYRNCINISYDINGNVYEIPNYCICEPAAYDESKFEVKPSEKLLTLKLRNVSKIFKVRASNYTKIEKLLETILSCLKEDGEKVELENLKLFYSGKELKPEESLWSYKIQEENIIQIFIVKKFND